MSLDAATVRANLERIRERVGPDVEILAAIKYLEADQLPALAEAGVTLVGENRAQELAAKQDAHGELFEWDFIGALQSRKVKDVAPRVRLIHSLASDSALAKLEAHPVRRGARAGERGRGGGQGGHRSRRAGRLHRALPGHGERSHDDAPVRRGRRRRAGATSPGSAELAAEHGLRRLSMGTTQDYWVAAEEGATIVRLGSALYS